MVYVRLYIPLFRLEYMPQRIFVKFKKATWQIVDLEPGVHPLTPKSQDLASQRVAEGQGSPLWLYTRA